jgi:hypothetical protein
MKKEGPRQADRYLPLRLPAHQPSSSSLSTKSHATTNSTASTNHLALMAGSPKRCLSFATPLSTCHSYPLEEHSFAKKYQQM